MCDPIIVALPPNKENITYKVHKKIELDVFTTMLCCDLNQEQMYFPKTIICVRTYTDCINMYLEMKEKLVMVVQNHLAIQILHSIES